MVTASERERRSIAESGWVKVCDYSAPIVVWIIEVVSFPCIGDNNMIIINIDNR